MLKLKTPVNSIKAKCSSVTGKRSLTISYRTVDLNFSNIFLYRITTCFNDGSTWIFNLNSGACMKRVKFEVYAELYDVCFFISRPYLCFCLFLQLEFRKQTLVCVTKSSHKNQGFRNCLSHIASCLYTTQRSLYYGIRYFLRHLKIMFLFFLIPKTCIALNYHLWSLVNIFRLSCIDR